MPFSEDSLASAKAVVDEMHREVTQLVADAFRDARDLLKVWTQGNVIHNWSEKRLIKLCGGRKHICLAACFAWSTGRLQAEDMHLGKVPIFWSIGGMTISDSNGSPWIAVTVEWTAKDPREPEPEKADG